MESRDIDHYMAAAVHGRQCLAPAAALHIDQQTVQTFVIDLGRLFTHTLQFPLQTPIKGRRGNRLAEQGRRPVLMHSRQGRSHIVVVGTAHAHIKEPTVAEHPARGTVYPERIKMIEQIDGVGKAETLTDEIAEISLGEAVVETHGHTRNRMAEAVEAQLPHSAEVISNATHKERIGSQAMAGSLTEQGQQTIGLGTHAAGH